MNKVRELHKNLLNKNMMKVTTEDIAELKVEIKKEQQRIAIDKEINHLLNELYNSDNEIASLEECIANLKEDLINKINSFEEEIANIEDDMAGMKAHLFCAKHARTNIRQHIEQLEAEKENL